jgi:hypothetical protein
MLRPGDVPGYLLATLCALHPIESPRHVMPGSQRYRAHVLALHLDCPVRWLWMKTRTHEAGSALCAGARHRGLLFEQRQRVLNGPGAPGIG